MNGALDGITVIELSVQLPGPYATMLLEQLGARIVKIEPPGGDVARMLDLAMYNVLNAGKESLELDLRDPAGQAELHRLCADADVFVEGFRPGVADRLGAGYETLASIREGLVYCSLSGYGQTGPYRLLAGHDVNYLGVGGGVDDDDGATRRIGMPVVDLAAGTTAALSILAALRRRDQSGVGAYLDLAMLDVAVVWSHLKPQTPARAPAYGVFRAGDGAALSLAALEDKFWRNLCDVLGWDDWKVEFADYGDRVRSADTIAQRLESALLARPRDAWLELFAAADLPAAPVHDLAGTQADAQVRERELFRNANGSLRAPLPPQLLDRVEAAT
jgi:crotonobetainyl-CoA:carnitine CoA-transferase CaiB-like acyl-CoA transferase